MITGTDARSVPDNLVGDLNDTGAFTAGKIAPAAIAAYAPWSRPEAERLGQQVWSPAILSQPVRPDTSEYEHPQERTALAAILTPVRRSASAHSRVAAAVSRARRGGRTVVVGPTSPNHLLGP